VKKTNETEVIAIKAPKFSTMRIRICGLAPYMQARFSEKARQAMMAKMEAGTTAKGKKAREARDFDADFRAAQHISTEGWVGIPAAAFRNAMIDACRTVGFAMTKARMSVFVEADGFDAVDGAPLVRLIAGEPERTEMAVRNQTGVVDVRIRPMWRDWQADVRIRFDSEQFTGSDALNLLARAGLQVGIGEGRPFSKSSNGMGFGLFEVQQVAA
jgi:hypothetical protein